MFTLEHRDKIRLIRYSEITILCFVIFIIYNIFSHGVYSNYMTLLFAWPLVLGFVPSLILALVPALIEPTDLTKVLYHTGLASVTVSSLLRGIFEIAGTSSPLQMPLMYFGIGTMVAGVIVYIYNYFRVRGKRKKEQLVKKEA